jgi:hypothetical protein
MTPQPKRLYSPERTFADPCIYICDMNALRMMAGKGNRIPDTFMSSPNDFTREDRHLKKHTPSYIYIYIYVCVCVCVCVNEARIPNTTSKAIHLRSGQMPANRDPCGYHGVLLVADITFRLYIYMLWYFDPNAQVIWVQKQRCTPSLRALHVPAHSSGLSYRCNHILFVKGSLMTGVYSLTLSITR